MTATRLSKADLVRQVKRDSLTIADLESRLGEIENFKEASAQQARMARTSCDLLNQAAAKAGIAPMGSDTPDHLADTILEMRDNLAKARGRIILARQAQACCEGCVTQWLVGDLDEDQQKRVLEAGQA